LKQLTELDSVLILLGIMCGRMGITSDDILEATEIYLTELKKSEAMQSKGGYNA
jgi:hypothetical protein